MTNSPSSCFQVRSMANSIIICFAFIAGFIVSKTFIDLVSKVWNVTKSSGFEFFSIDTSTNLCDCHQVQSPLKFSGTFWLYAADCIIGALFTAIFVPETRSPKTLTDSKKLFWQCLPSAAHISSFHRNKSIEEIQAIFRSKGDISKRLNLKKIIIQFWRHQILTTCNIAGKKGLGEHPGLGHPLDSVTWAASQVETTCEEDIMWELASYLEPNFHPSISHDRVTLPQTGWVGRPRLWEHQMSLFCLSLPPIVTDERLHS